MSLLLSITITITVTITITITITSSLFHSFYEGLAVNVDLYRLVKSFFVRAEHTQEAAALDRGLGEGEGTEGEERRGKEGSG
jgi:hypothetical protein